jgi:hypothetical protein
LNSVKTGIGFRGGFLKKETAAKKDKGRRRPKAR